MQTPECFGRMWAERFLTIMENCLAGKNHIKLKMYGTLACT